MNLKLKRTEFTDNSTIGELSIENEFECYVLEDVVRDYKIYGETAIPYGTYEVVVSYSNRFKRYLPLLPNVPNFTGVRIHTGNKSTDTEGCLIVGATKKEDKVEESRKAFNILYPKIVYALQNGEKVFLEITK